MRKEERNLIALIVGIALMFIGLFGIAITVAVSPRWVAAPLSVIIVIGAILAITGGLRKW